MKIEIMVTRHSVLRTLTAALLVIFLFLLFSSPFYQFGRESSVFANENGAENMLLGSWSLESEKDGQLGLTKIEITGKRTMITTRSIDGQPVSEEGKVSYKEKTGALKLTLDDGTVIETVFQPKLVIDSVKTASLIGYAAYPYDCTELTQELTGFFEKREAEYGYQDAVIPSVIILLLIILGIVLLLVWHGKAKGAVPAIVVSAVTVFALWLIPAFQFAMTGARVFLTIWLICIVISAALDYAVLSKKE